MGVDHRSGLRILSTHHDWRDCNDLPFFKLTTFPLFSRAVTQCSHGLRVKGDQIKT